VTWWIASLIANVNIAVVEYLNRAGKYDSFGEAILRTGVFVMLAQWGLWRCWDGAPSFMTAWAFFTAGNLILRLVSNHFLVGEPLNLLAGAGVALVVAGAQLVKMGAMAK
jgi:hypothetical protein